MTKKLVDQREPRLFRGDYSDKQIIVWLNKLLMALELPERLEKTAEEHRQSLNYTDEKLKELKTVRETSIYNGFPDSIRNR